MSVEVVSTIMFMSATFLLVVATWGGENPHAADCLASAGTALMIASGLLFLVIGGFWLCVLGVAALIVGLICMFVLMAFS